MCVICVDWQRTLTHTETQSIYGLIVMPFIIFTPTHNCMVETFGKCKETKAYHLYWDNIIFGILRHRHGHQHIFAMLREESELCVRAASVVGRGTGMDMSAWQN